MKKRVFLAVASSLLCAAALPRHTSGSQTSPSARVTAEAVWRPTAEQIAAIRKNCREEPAKIGECFVSAMRSSGASREAVAFAKSLSDKGYGYLRDFRGTGNVGIAYVEYAFRANEMEGVFLVNGSPTPLDVDDPSLISPDDLLKNDSYAELLRRYPNLARFPGDRFHTNQPVEKSLGGAAQEFDVGYALRDGCHACAAVGELQLAFDFDSTGKFKGARVEQVTSEIRTTARTRFEIRPWSPRRNLWRLTQAGDPKIVRFVHKSEEPSIFFGGVCLALETWIFEALDNGTTELGFLYSSPTVESEVDAYDRMYVLVVN